MEETMEGTMKEAAPAIREVMPNRVVCPSCGASQGAPRKGRKPLCLICSEPLQAIDVAAVASLGAPEATTKRPLIAEARKIFAGGETSTFSCEELDDVIRSERRVTSALALIPLCGIWLLSRSTRHTASEKTLLGLASLFVSLLLALGIWSALPDAQGRAAAKHARIDTSLRQLSDLIRDYVREHGALPDAAAWQRSAEAGDLRFFDPWGRRFRYAPNAADTALGTYGRDDAPGGYGEDTDIFVAIAYPPS